MVKSGYRRLSLAVLCNAFASIANNAADSDEAEIWLKSSKLAELALSEIGINQSNGDLSAAIERVRNGREVKLIRRDKVVQDG